MTAPAKPPPTLTLVTAPRPLPADHVERNPGIPLDLDVVRAIRVNRSAVERRAATMATRRTVKKEWQAAWLLRAITLIDLTTLSGDDTPGPRAPALRQGAPPAARRSRRRARRRRPAASRSARSASITRSSRPPSRRSRASGIPVAAVSTGFPAGLTPLEQRARGDPRVGRGRRAARSTSSSRARQVLTGNWQALYDEVSAFREACGEAHLKTILAHRRAGDAAQCRARQHGRDDGRRRLHQDLDRQGEASTPRCRFASSMVRMIRDYHERDRLSTIGYKPAGGIRTAKDALD